MKKIITALGNNTLNDELKKYSKYNILADDIFYQEGLIDFISQNEADIIILSGLLQGENNLIDFVSQVRSISISSRIIIIVDEITAEERNILISKGVFDILYDEESGIEDVIEAVDREEPINLKAQLNNEIKNIREELEKTTANYSNVTDINSIVSSIQKQEVISIFGTNGSGKSSIACGLVKAFAKKTKAKILLIDLDTINGNLDEILQVSKVPPNVELIMDEDKKCGLNYAADLSIKNRFDTNVLDEIVINCNGFDFLSGNTSLHYCQNVLNEDFYNYLIKCAKEKYDFIFLDLSSNLFLDATKWALKESTNVLFVTENTNICLKKTIQLLEVVFNVWNIYKGKFKLVLNRVGNEIDPDIFSEVIKIKNIGIIKQNAEHLPESYEKILTSLNYVPKKSFIAIIKDNTKVISSFLSNIRT